MNVPTQEAFTMANVPEAPEDPLYRLMREYRQDTNEKKIDLGIGAYRDEHGKPWVLPVVKKAEALLQTPEFNHEYLPIRGLDSFLAAAQRLMLGNDSPAIHENRVSSMQTVSGTGAVHLGATFISRFCRGTERPKAFISDPTWPNHYQIFSQSEFDVQYYPYYLVESQKIDIKAMIRCLEEAPSKSLVVLQGCAHNPTGLDPSQEEWRQIADVMAEKGHFPFFDNAYQGFASGDLTQDSWACRYFIGRGFECCVAQSFAKNLGMYGERVGAFHYICSPSPDASHVADRISSQLAILQRAHISNPPAYGAHIASRVLNDPKLFSQWQHELGIISGRLTKVREEIRSKLEGRETPGSWAFLSTQIGMFSYTGLSKNQVRLLKSKWHIYMTENGRISVAGLNPNNMEYFIDAVDDVVRACP
ncbi:Aspartate aminotransferase [Penicillium rubens]|nr:Aspartate aminotransferase [Penicillium rubens]